MANSGETLKVAFTSDHQAEKSKLWLRLWSQFGGKCLVGFRKLQHMFGLRTRKLQLYPAAAATFTIRMSRKMIILLKPKMFIIKRGIRCKI